MKKMKSFGIVVSFILMIAGVWVGSYFAVEGPDGELIQSLTSKENLQEKIIVIYSISYFISYLSMFLLFRLWPGLYKIKDAHLITKTFIHGLKIWGVLAVVVAISIYVGEISSRWEKVLEALIIPAHLVPLGYAFHVILKNKEELEEIVKNDYLKEHGLDEESISNLKQDK